MSWTPAAPEQLPALVAEYLARMPGTVRVAVDGAPATDPEAFADALVPLLEAGGRPTRTVRATSFWRDASLRLEHGREDVESYAGWLDVEALRREVLVPAAAEGRYLPSLRDPQTNRSTREAARALPASAILLISGSLLLGRGLPFDLAVHLTMSAGALRRRTPPALAWTLPAYERYDADARPCAAAHIVVKVDDPRHPAVRRQRPA